MEEIPPACKCLEAAPGDKNANGLTAIAERDGLDLELQPGPADKSQQVGSKTLAASTPSPSAEESQQIVSETSEPSTSSKLFEIKSTKDKGLGMFAKEFIPRGVTILEEKPLILLRGQDYTPEEINAAFDELSSDEKKKYLSLHSIHGLKDGGLNVLHLQGFEERRKRSILGRLAARCSRTKSVVSIYFANSMGAGEDAAAVLFEASRVNHSCIPNASYVWSEELGVERLRSVKDIQVGEEITISYCYHFLKSNQRIKYLQSVYNFTCSCPACFDRSVAGSFAAQSHDRRWRLAELGAVSYSNETLELRAQGELAQLITAEGLCIPDLGAGYETLSRIWEKRGNIRYARDFTEKAMDVFTTCLGPDFRTTQEQVNRLRELESRLKQPSPSGPCTREVSATLHQPRST